MLFAIPIGAKVALDPSKFTLLDMQHREWMLSSVRNKTIFTLEELFFFDIVKAEYAVLKNGKLFSTKAEWIMEIKPRD